jgi:hypothetical protein
VLKGASVKPEGDVVLAKVLNRGSDEVLRSVQRAQDERGATVSVATSELANLIDPARKDQIKSDVDEELWEEMETGLISYKRGDIRIPDRGRLEAQSCECYARTKAEYERLFAA